MKKFFFLWLCLVQCLASSAQDMLLPDSQDSLISQIPKRYLGRIQVKTDFVQKRIDKGTEKMLRRMEKFERQLQNKVQKADPLKAEELFGPASAKVSNLKSKFFSAASQTGIGNGYIDNYADTLENSLKFLDAVNLGSMIKGSKLESVQNGVKVVKDKLQMTRQLQADIQERKRQLKEALANVAGCKPLLGKISKEAGYYRQYLNDCKEVLNDPSKAEQKVMNLLRAYQPFKDFMQKNSALAGLFNINMSEDPQQALLYLQSRSFTDNRIQQAIGSDPAAQQAVSQQLQQSVSQIDQLKNKLPVSGSMADLEEQNLNPMRTKTFWQRLQYGADIQSQRSNNLMPVMTDLALQVTYKFNPKLDAGTGIAYKMGWGQSLSHLTITNEGISLRSVANYKVKGRFLATGGIEYNHFSRFANINTLRNWNGWTRSTLLGVKIMIRQTGRPKANMVILYDFEARRTIPASSPLKIRYQYTL